MDTSKGGNQSVLNTFEMDCTNKSELKVWMTWGRFGVFIELCVLCNNVFFLMCENDTICRSGGFNNILFVVSW